MGGRSQRSAAARLAAGVEVAVGEVPVPDEQLLELRMARR
jgi:hypothetical protein